MNQIPMGINTEALDEWISYRLTEHKYVMSDTSIKKHVNRLVKHSHEHQQYMVDWAMELGWKRVYEVPEPQKVVSSRDRSIEDDLSDRSWADNIVQINKY
jgi:hypothetical protein